MAPRSQRLRYGVAISSTLLALALVLLLRPLTGLRPLAPVLAAVVFSAWYGGLAPGLLATFLGALGGLGLFTLAAHPAGATSVPDVPMRIGMFLVVSVLISGLTGALHAAQGRVETNARKLQLSEAWYRRVLDTAYEGIWVTDAMGRTDYVNDRMAEMLGYTVGEMLGHSLFDFMDGAARAEAERSLERRKQGITEQHDFRFRCRNGADLWTIVSTNPILNETGEFAGALAMITDVTERKRLEEELRQRAEALAEADRRKDEFLAMLAHELRNPLAAIWGALHLARVSETDELRRQTALDAVERQVRHQTRLVDDLLDVSRITRGKIVLRPERLDLARLLRESVQDHRRALEAASLHLALVLPEQSVWVNGDATRLAQVVSNLLQNAAKFTDPGGRVTVRLEVEDQAVITVRDTGIGITPEMVSHLFEPLTQADRTLDRSRGGLGLGLALVKGLVELHGGEVGARSDGPGCGATFTVELPWASDPAAPLAATTPSRAAAPNGAAFGRRILVVEDNHDVAEALCGLLQLYGHQVEVASCGRDGVAAARRLRPEVVLCDIGLPGMDGYAVARALRRDPSTAGARLIAVSGYGMDEDRKRSEEAGFELHLTKPVRPADLQRLLAAD